MAGLLAMVFTLAGCSPRWRIERDFQELKQELVLGHYKGRNWRGFHHHASLCIAAYGFLMIDRQKGVKKNAARFKMPALPEGFEPRRRAAGEASEEEHQIVIDTVVLGACRG